MRAEGGASKAKPINARRNCCNFFGFDAALRLSAAGRQRPKP